MEMEIGELASFPPYVLHSALCFLDGRALTIFETASRGTQRAVQDSPGLYKALLVRSVSICLRVCRLMQGFVNART